MGKQWLAQVWLSDNQELIIERWLPNGGLRAKFCNKDWIKVDCKQNSAIMFSQKWFISKVLQWYLCMNGFQTKFCNDVWSKIDCEQTPAIIFGQG